MSKADLIEALYSKFWNQGLYELARGMFSEDVELGNGNKAQGIDAVISLAERWRAGFPDMRETVEALAVEGDVALVMFRFEGTHTGSFQGYKATGRRIVMRGADYFQFRGDRIAIWRYVEDRLSLAGGLGLVAPFLQRGEWPHVGSTHICE